MNRKMILSLFATSMILLTLMGPLFISNVKAQTQHDATWYMTVPGVLHDDYYTLYPFKNDASLKWGFSQFGEMINSIDNVGLEYRDRDAFAPPAGPTVPSEITKNKWMSGWLINITYNNPTLGRRNVWATAQHADLVAHGYDWIRVHCGYAVAGGPATEAAEDPRDPGLLISDPTSSIRRGGRKTNGTATTEPIRVLYDGPRRFVARTVTHIYDWVEEVEEYENEPLLDVVFTYIFNKDKKEVIVIKDIKESTTKFVFGLLDIPGTENQVNGAFIQFSNRGEWDIGPATPPNTFASYVHFYADYNGEGQYTDYDLDYHLNPTLPANPHSTHGSQPDNPGGGSTYDLAQIISADQLFVGWAAFWPSLSNWHVDAGYQDVWWRSMMSGEDAADAPVEPFQSPYLIGEWDFMLTRDRRTVDSLTFDRQFRGVTVYGLTDLWDGDDADISGALRDTIDSEVQYQVDEVFTPWDLVTAVHKDTARWVDFHPVTTSEYDNAYTNNIDLNITLTNTPVCYASIWEQYCSFSERVEWGGARKIPYRSVWGTYDYNLYVDATTGVGIINIPWSKVPAVGTAIKVLYSTETEYSKGPVSYTWSANITAGSGGWKSFDYSNTHITWTDKLGVQHDMDIADFNFSFRNTTALTQNVTWTYGEYMEHWRIYPFKVFKDETVENRWQCDNFGIETETQTDVTLEMEMDDLDIQWQVTGPAHTDVHFTYLHPDIYYNYTVTYNTVTKNYTVTAGIELGYMGELYTEQIPGRYEWVVVGNHSRTLDSVGASMVSAAFKNKQVEIGNGGLDMMDMWGTNVPYLLADLGTATWRAGGPAWTDIYDSRGRLALVDDWCTRYPVTTSNIITVAGPPANLMSEYWNDLTDAIYIYGILGTLLTDVIFAPTCWYTTYEGNYLGRTYSGTGYGVITTYKDINGTVGFMIYGISGDDTYYTCKWFHEHGIYRMQTENPGVTTWILKLTYTDPHAPTVLLVERLGTISEKTPHDP